MLRLHGYRIQKVTSTTLTLPSCVFMLYSLELYHHLVFLKEHKEMVVFYSVRFRQVWYLLLSCILLYAEQSS